MTPTPGLLAEAAQALNRHQPETAMRLLEQLLAHAPGSLDALFLLGLAHVMQGTSGAAVPLLRQVVAQRPRHADAHMYLGCALQDTGAADDEALRHLRAACELAPQRAANWYNLGKALKEQAQLDAAAGTFDRALALDAHHALARIGVADIATMQGDIDRAVAEYRQVLRQQPDRAEAWHGLANLKTRPLSAVDAEQIRRALHQPNIPPDTRVLLGFSLYRALEDQQDYAGAFKALHQANDDKRHLVEWDAAREHATIDRILAAFHNPLPTPVDPDLGREIIFIVSLPRSGSTLVEHILASHPEVEGANEIPDLAQVIEGESRRRGRPFPDWVTTATAEDWHRLGRSYLARTAHWREKRPRSTDKAVNNWPLVGAVRAMLPGARIVHGHRDPVETCFACYRQLFRHGVHYSYNLDEMAERYRDYRRLAEFWLAQSPEHLLDLPYETLVREPEAQIRRLLAFCDLPFDPACLAPHRTKREVLSTASAAQVREPIRADTAHSAPYLPWLQPLREGLAR